MLLQWGIVKLKPKKTWTSFLFVVDWTGMYFRGNCFSKNCFSGYGDLNLVLMIILLPFKCCLQRYCLQTNFQFNNYWSSWKTSISEIYITEHDSCSYKNSNFPEMINFVLFAILQDLQITDLSIWLVSNNWISVRDRLISTLAKISELLTFLTPWYAYVRMRIRGWAILVFWKNLGTY